MDDSIPQTRSTQNETPLRSTSFEMKSISSSDGNRGHSNPREEILPTSASSFPHFSSRFRGHVLPAGESGRKGFHPIHFMRICWRSASRASRLCNIFWPVVPAAIAVRYIRPELHSLIFTLNYIAMIPCANLIGFMGRELSRKINKVFGLMIEATIGSVVEILLFMTLIRHDEFEVIKAAILGSILTTLLLCLGMCFVVGGIRYNELEFSEIVGEVGSDLLLTAGFALIIPSAFHVAVSANGRISPHEIESKVLHVSRITSGLLILAFFIYTFFQIQTHMTAYSEIFEQDENKYHGRVKNDDNPRLTLTESIVGVVASVILATIIAINLVEEIHFILHVRQLTDGFVGLILVPLVEKFSEHLTAIDECWDNKINVALSQILGSTIQTALFNGPLVILVGWALNKPMDLNFDMLNVVLLILAILVVGNFLRDQKSNYLEGSLIVIVYVTIATTIFYYPDESRNTENLVLNNQ